MAINDLTINGSDYLVIFDLEKRIEYGNLIRWEVDTLKRQLTIYGLNPKNQEHIDLINRIKQQAWLQYRNK